MISPQITFAKDLVKVLQWSKFTWLWTVHDTCCFVYVYVLLFCYVMGPNCTGSFLSAISLKYYRADLQHQPQTILNSKTFYAPSNVVWGAHSVVRPSVWPSHIIFQHDYLRIPDWKPFVFGKQIEHQKTQLQFDSRTFPPPLTRVMPLFLKFAGFFLCIRTITSEFLTVKSMIFGKQIEHQKTQLQFDSSTFLPPQTRFNSLFLNSCLFMFRTITSECLTGNE